MGGDTLDAFAPLSHFTQRVNNGQMESTRTNVAKSIILPDGTVLERTRVKEEDYISEAADLLSAKVENPIPRRE